MVRIILFLLLAMTLSASAQRITTYDSRFGQTAIASKYIAVDIGITDPSINPEYRDYGKTVKLRSYKSPSLIDSRTGVGVAITGTVTMAEAQLNQAINNQFPAQVRLKNEDKKKIAEDGIRRTKNSNSSAKLGDLEELYKLISDLSERVEMLEAKK